MGEFFKNLGDLLLTPFKAIESGFGALFNANQSRLAHERSMDQMQRQHELNEASAQAAYDREIAADSTKYQRQVSDLQAAGLNPMLAVGQSAGAVHSSPATTSAGSGAQASMPNLGSILDAVRVQTERKIADADIKLKEAQARNLESKTTGQEIQNWISEHTKDLQVEAARLENELKSGKITLTKEQVSECREKINLLVKQQDTESARAGALLAEAVYKNAQADQIVQLLPYQKALMSAQTANQKAAAALAWAHEAYQRGLLDNGYLDSFCREAVASANEAESSAAVAGVKAAIQSGDYSHSAIGYVPVISEAITGLSNAFGVIGSVFHGVLK